MPIPIGILAASAPSVQDLYVALPWVDVFGSSTIRVFPWSSAGFGSIYSAPSGYSGYSTRGVDFNSTSNVIAFGQGEAFPYLHAYAWSSAGFGTKFSNPSTTGVNGANDVNFHPLDSAIVLGDGTTANSTHVWAWSGSGFGSKFANPASPLGGTTSIVQFRPVTGNRLMATGAGAYYRVWAWSGSGFGTSYTTTLGFSTSIEAASWSATGNEIAFSSFDTSPHIHAWPFSTGFGTKFSAPATAVGSVVRGIAFHPDNSAIAVGTTGSPYVHSYAWSTSGFGSKFSNPASGITNQASTPHFGKTGNQVIFRRNDDTFSAAAWQWSSSGFGTRYSNGTGATIPTGTTIAIG